MTPTPKDPVDALMALVVVYAQQYHNHRTMPRSTTSPAFDAARAAVEASARALAAVPAQVEPDGRLHADGYFTWNKGKRPDYIADRGLPCDFYLAPPIAQQAGGVPAGFVAVPLSFVQGFHTLAHNYSLRAVPPDYYQGIQGDAFSNAYRRCGEDLAKLRDMLAAAPSPSAVQPLSEAQRVRYAARSVVNHWCEFGPEHGFDEVVDQLTKALS